MKIYSLVLLLLISINAYASEKLKLCYVSSNISGILPSAKDKNKRFGGFLAAIDMYKEIEKIDDVEFKVYSLEERNIFVPDGIKWASEEKCSIVLGLVTSRDALIAGPYLKQHNLIGFSSTATNSKLSDSFPYILSASTSTNSYSKALLSHIKGKNVYVIYSPINIYSLFYKEVLERENQGLIPIKISSDGSIEQALLNKIKKGLIVFTTYPLESIPSLLQVLNKENVGQLSIIGTQSWMETHAFQKQNVNFDKFKKVQIFSAWNVYKLNSKFKKFKKKYTELFKSDPDHDSSYDYDVTSMVLQCWKKTKSSKLLKKCLTSKMEFNGVTGLYKYDGQKSHPDRTELLINYSKKML